MNTLNFDETLFSEYDLKNYEEKLISTSLTNKQNFINKLYIEKEYSKYLLRRIQKYNLNIEDVVNLLQNNVDKTPLNIKKMRIELEKLKLRKTEIEIKAVEKSSIRS